MILHDAETFAETLIVHNFSFTQKFDRFSDIWIFYQTQDVVICGAGFHFSGEIFRQICDRIAGGLERQRTERRSACCLWPYANRMIYIVRFESAGFYFFHGEIAGQLVDDGGNDFEV